MSEENQAETEFEQVQAEAQKAAEEKVEIADEVRDITLKALSEGKLDGARIKGVIKAVVEGVSIGAANKNADVKSTLKEAFSGVDEALAKTAEASKLAVEEAMGRAKDYNKDELNKAIKDIKELENIFVQTVKSVSKSGSALVKETLDDLITHAKNTGTEVGKHSKEVASNLTQQLAQAAQETVTASADAARTLASNIAEAAAGFLSGLAESLKPKK
ncbi:MAG: hypothetical protein PVF82_14840 [Gammaproteobacteria bacterium]